MDSLKYRGIFWLPENPDTKLSGTLTFDPLNGAELDLMGSFKDRTELNIIKQYNFITGISDNGRLITLVKLYEVSTHSTNYGQNSKYSPHYFFIGHHFNEDKDLYFNKAVVYFYLVDSWFHNYKSSISIDFSPYIKSINFQKQSPDDFNFEEYKISFDLDIKKSISLPKEIKITQQRSFIFTFDKELYFSNLLNDYIYPFQNLLSFCIGSNTTPININFYSNNIFRYIDLKNTKKDNIQIQFFYHTIPISIKERVIHPNYYTIPAEIFINNFIKIWPKWLDFIKSYMPVYYLYFSVLYNDEMYLENKFLNLMNAIESFHRRKEIGKYISDDENIGLTNSIISSLPTDLDGSFKKSIKTKLRYLHEYSLRKRFKLLFNKFQDELFFIQNTSQFIEKCVNTRNYYTHYDQSIKDEDKFNDDELYYAVNNLLKFLEILFLNEIGIEKIDIIESLKRRIK